VKLFIAILIVAFISKTWRVDSENDQKPCISFSFDDGNANELLDYKGEVWNDRINNQRKGNNRFE